MLQVYSINVYALYDPSTTLSFVTTLVVIKFDALLNVLSKPFLVVSPGLLGDYKNSLQELSHNVAQ